MQRAIDMYRMCQALLRLATEFLCDVREGNFSARRAHYRQVEIVQEV